MNCVDTPELEPLRQLDGVVDSQPSVDLFVGRKPGGESHPVTDRAADGGDHLVNETPAVLACDTVVIVAEVRSG